MKKILTALGLLISSSTMATGFYAGGQLGTDFGISHFNVGNNKSDNKDTGMTYGIYGGYRYDFNTFFVAGELECYKSTTKTKNTLQANPNVAVGQMTVENTQDGNSAALQILAGLPIGDSTEVYALLGAIRTPMQTTATLSLPGVTSVHKQTSDLNGKVFGFGVQYRINDQVAARLNYKYVAYEELKLNDITSKLASHIVSIGAQYSF
ncbi:MAG: outer membrane beta-barrel protein [Candidatus Endonucleobacter sp. (ex Gigantidas childressi)]|nr:outer membrane beta-barrel protein [Candidatus Endonucleobacter sp. (ex Gigantidas childressi)]